MKVILISDLHGSIENIRQVLYKGEYDKLLFAGDMFGYFPFNTEIINLFKEKQVEYIIGNHDIYFIRELFPRLFEEKFGDISIKMLTSDEYNNKYGVLFEDKLRLNNLDVEFFRNASFSKKVVIDDINFLICHGSPMNAFNEYIYPDYTSFDNLYSKFDFDILVMGHTHKKLFDNTYKRYILNPGSCTIPRGELKPTYIEIDTSLYEFKFIELEQKIRFKNISKSKIKLL